MCKNSVDGKTRYRKVKYEIMQLIQSSKRGFACKSKPAKTSPKSLSFFFLAKYVKMPIEDIKAINLNVHKLKKYMKPGCSGWKLSMMLELFLSLLLITVWRLFEHTVLCLK